MKKLFGLLLLFSLAAFAQQGDLTGFAGRVNAAQYGSWSLPIFYGTPAGAGAIIVGGNGRVTLPDGVEFVPFKVGTPIRINDGPNSETVTPTAIGNCGNGKLFNQCTVTATFTKAHGGGAGTTVSSGTAGLQEAINALLSTAGLVVISGSWNGTSSMITTTATGSTAVGVEDLRVGIPSYYAWGGSHYVLSAGSGNPVVLNPAGDQILLNGFDLINSVGGGFRAANTAATPTDASVVLNVNGSGQGGLFYTEGAVFANVHFNPTTGAVVLNPQAGGGADDAAHGVVINNAGLYVTGTFSDGVSLHLSQGSVIVEGGGLASGNPIVTFGSTGVEGVFKFFPQTGGGSYSLRSPNTGLTNIINWPNASGTLAAIATTLSPSSSVCTDINSLLTTTSCGSTLFSAIGAGTNTSAAMLLGSGSSLATAGTGSINGIIFANASETVQQAMTASAGGLSIVPAGYAGGDFPLGTQITNITIPLSSFQIAKTLNIDYRNGAISESYFNPTFGPFNNFAFAHSIIENLTATLGNPPNSAYTFGVMQNVYDGGSNYQGNKANYAGFVNFLTGWAQGQHIGMGGQTLGYGNGDNLAFSFSSVGWGGSNAQTDEGTHLGDINISQGWVTAVCSIPSGASTGATSLTLSCSAGDKTFGSGRYAIDMTLASSAYGTVTTIAGSGPVTYTFSGVVTTDTITTDSTAVTTPGTQAITTVATTTGITANTTLACISDAAKFECFKPTVVAANSLTATFRFPHPSGATISWGVNAGQLIELNLDRWTATGQVGFVNVLNTLRRAFPVVGCPTASTCQVWISLGGGYNGYTGMAKTSAATNAYTMYPGAEIISVQSGGTVSDTITLSPNNVAWANSDAVEVPDYPSQHITFWNAQINQFFASQPNSAAGAGITWNGRFCCNDGFWGINFKPAANSDYAGHGGNLTVPTFAFGYNNQGAGLGPVRYGLYLNTRPDLAAVVVGCPLDTSGNSNCNINDWFTPGPILLVGGNSGNDRLNYNPGLMQWSFNSGGFVNWFIIPKLTGAAINVTGAVDPSLEVGYVSCTQANCAGSATTLYTATAADSLYKADVSIACSTATATATGTVTISYTDASNTAQTIVSSAAACTTLGAASVAAFSTPFIAKAATVIQYSVTQVNAPAGLRARVAIYQESTN